MTQEQFIETCKTGDEGVVTRALREQPDLAGARNASGETPLLSALYRGHRGVVDLLLDAGAPLDLFSAAALGRVDVIDRLSGAGPSGLDAHAYDGWTPIHLAAFFGHTDAVNRLIALGARVNAWSTNSIHNTPLHAAVAGGRVEAALTLIAHGADVNAADAGGHTPLHIAAEGGYVPVVKALLARHADPHAVDAEDRTPLARAAAKNHVEVVDLMNLAQGS